MILRHNDRKTYFLMTYHPSLTDFVSLPHIVCYYRLMFPHFVFKNMSLKEYVFLSLCLQNILSFLCFLCLKKLCFLCQKPPIFLILTIYLTITLCVAKQMLSGWYIQPVLTIAVIMAIILFLTLFSATIGFFPRSISLW